MKYIYLVKLLNTEPAKIKDQVTILYALYVIIF